MSRRPHGDSSRERSKLNQGGGVKGLATSTSRLEAKSRGSLRTKQRTSPKKESRTPTVARAKHESDSFHRESELGKSAAESMLERELADLRLENISLRKELASIKTMHEQLIHESPEEKFCEKRVNLLKSQILQLERQVLIMSQALGTRGELLVDLFNTMEWIEEREKLSSSSDRELMQKVSALKLRLSKYMPSGTLEKLAEPVRFLDTFLRPKRCTVQRVEAVTLVDVCRGGALDHLNIKHVSRLESKLAELFGQLVQLKASLDTAPASIAGSRQLLQPIREQCSNHVTKSCAMIGDCCHDLLCLSLIIPTSPWPPLKGTEVSPSFSAGDILKNIPAPLRSKKEVKEAIEAAVLAFTHSTNMQEEKCKALEKELQFHKDVYNLQVNHVDCLFKGVRTGYENFERTLQEIVCTPIETLLAKYDTMAQTTNEETLRDFLSHMKLCFPELKDAIRRIKRSDNVKLDSDMQPTGGKALSLVGQQFFQHLQKLEGRRSKT